MNSIVGELHLALRRLARDRAFVAAAVIALALGIGTNAAMFGLVSRLMLAPPPGIEAPEQLMHVRFRHQFEGGAANTASTTSYPMFEWLRSRADVFAGAAASRMDSVVVGRGAETGRVSARAVTGDYFSTLGAKPALGRLLGHEDDKRSQGAAAVVVSHAYWRRTLGGEPDVIGRELVIDDMPFSIIGVAAPGFNGEGVTGTDLYLPLMTAMRDQGSNWYSNTLMNVVSVVVRVRSGVDTRVAVQSANRVQLDDRFGEDIPVIELMPLVPGIRSPQSQQARVALWLAGISVIVMLIAVANVGTLFLLRAARQERDVAIRVALGARMHAIARHSLIESLVIAVAGCFAGLVLSRWLSDLIRTTLLPSLAPTEAIVDRRVLLISITSSLVAALLVASLPLRQLRRPNLLAPLSSGSSHGSTQSLGAQRFMIALQVTMCTMLIFCSALFVRSLQRVQSQDLGFTTARLLHVTLDFRGYASAFERDAAYERAVARIRAMPEVSAASVVAGVPFGPHNIPPISIPGLPEPPNVGGQVPIMYAATPDYLRMMGVTLLSGRLLTDADNSTGAPQVMLINETMATTVWRGASALGRCVRIGFGSLPFSEDVNPADNAPCREVVGVVRDSRARSLRPEGNEDRLMQYYVPFAQLPAAPVPDQPRAMGILVESRGDIGTIGGRIRRAVHDDARIALHARARPYQDLIDPQLRSWRLGATLFPVFGALATAIAAVGLFGVVSYAVRQRRREIGVRLALGGTSASIATLILVDALRMTAAGISAGLVLSLAATPLIRAMLFQTSTADPLSILAMIVVLVTTTVLASAVPAWRAGRMSPMIVLASEN